MLLDLDTTIKLSQAWKWGKFKLLITSFFFFEIGQNTTVMTSFLQKCFFKTFV